MYKTWVLNKRCWTVLIKVLGKVRERRTVPMPQGCRRSLSQNTYKEKDCIVSIPFHPSSDSRNKRFTSKSSVFLLGSLARPRGFTSNNNLWTDETTFTRDGIYKIHNEHRYAAENPHLIRESRSQTRFKVNIWIGLIGNQLVGPYLDQHHSMAYTICSS